MNERDEVRLRDMLDTAHKARAFVTGRTREELDGDDMLAFALVRAIEIIGEAASRVTPQAREQYSNIPWKNIIGMRNRIIHDYVNIDHNIVWDVATLQLPVLIAQLEKILPPDRG